MPYWVKFTPDSASYPVAMGPFDTQAEADAAQASRAAPPSGSPPIDAGIVVEADLGYQATLKHPVGKIAIGDVANILYSDGTAEPVA